MSWREILKPGTASQNPHNPQNPMPGRHFEDIENIEKAPGIPELASIPSAITAIPEHPNSENSRTSTDLVPAPEDAASMRLSTIESSGLALLVKVDDGYMVWASTRARIPDEWAAYPVFTTEELRLSPPGYMQAARDWLALKRTFPGSTLHPISESSAPTLPPAPAFVTCATCQHYLAGEQGGIGTCTMSEDQRTTDPSERYPAGHPMQPALYPHARRICTAWEAP